MASKKSFLKLSRIFFEEGSDSETNFIMVKRGILLGETDSLIFSHRVHIYIQSDVILLVLTRHLWQKRSNTMRPLIIPASRLLPGLTLHPQINETNSEILPPKSTFLGQNRLFKTAFWGFRTLPPLYSRLNPEKRAFPRSSMTSIQ